MQKSFDATPAGCQNILIAGVVTPEMRSRLEQIGIIKVFILDDLLNDEEWDDVHRAESAGEQRAHFGFHQGPRVGRRADALEVGAEQQDDAGFGVGLQAGAGHVRDPLQVVFGVTRLWG